MSVAVQLPPTTGMTRKTILLTGENKTNETKNIVSLNNRKVALRETKHSSNIKNYVKTNKGKRCC